LLLDLKNLSTADATKQDSILLELGAIKDQLSLGQEPAASSLSVVLASDSDHATRARQDALAVIAEAIRDNTLTEAQLAATLRNTPLPVSGTVSVDNHPTSTEVSNFPANQTVSGTVAISNLPATQPVSAVELPLPTNAATELTLAAVNTKLPDQIAGRMPVSLDAGSIGLTRAELDTSPVGVAGTFWQVTQPVSVDALPLPNGAATQLTLADALTKLGEILTRLDTPLPLPIGASTDDMLDVIYQALLATLTVKDVQGGTRYYDVPGNVYTAFGAASTAAIALPTLGASNEVMFHATERCFISLGDAGVAAAQVGAGHLIVGAGERFHMRVTAGDTHFRVIQHEDAGVLTITAVTA
jgi:hypothetical protein